MRKGAIDSVLKFAREQAGQNVAEPPAFRAAVDKIARSGGTPLGLVEGDRILGVIHLKDVVKPDVTGPLHRAAPHGHQDRDDHRRQSGDGGGDRLGSRR